MMRDINVPLSHKCPTIFQDFNGISANIDQKATFIVWHDCCGMLSAYQKNTTNNLTNHSRNINPIRLGHTSSSIEYDTQPQLSGVVF